MVILLSHFLPVLYILVEDRTMKVWMNRLIGLLNIKTWNGTFSVILSALDTVIVRSKWDHLYIISADMMLIGTIKSKLLEFLFHLNGIQNWLFRNMEIWNVEDLTNLNYEGNLVEYPDFQGDTLYGELIRINADRCTWYFQNK